MRALVLADGRINVALSRELMDVARFNFDIGFGFFFARFEPCSSRDQSRGASAELHHVTLALFAQNFLDAFDGQAVAVKKRTDATQEIEIVGAVIAPAAAALQRPDLLEAGFPESQHVLRQVEIVRDFTDRPECVRRLVHHRRLPPPD